MRRVVVLAGACVTTASACTADFNGSPGSFAPAPMFYQTGRGGPQDYTAAIAAYRRAAKQGDVVAMFSLGVIYEGGQGVPANPRKAVRWYRRAAKVGYAPAEYRLAMLYERGEAERRNFEQSRQLQQTATEGGPEATRAKPAAPGGKADDGEARFKRAEALILSRGFVPSGSDAVNELKSAAERGNPEAQYDLGYCFEHGIGVAANKLQAFVWYSRAAGARGRALVHAAATQAADRIQRQMTEAERQAAASMLRGAALAPESAGG
jgi:TPR repeat protein